MKLFIGILAVVFASSAHAATLCVCQSSAGGTNNDLTDSCCTDRTIEGSGNCFNPNQGKFGQCCADWGVVLLDEAEVFFQKRSLHDLQRNALVSMLLTVLEYYEGVLILTNSRAGLFDVGFKSRIQLALRYENLSQDTREQIWHDFLDRLETFNEDIDVPDLRKNIVRLSRYEINERALDFEVLRDIVNMSTRFDAYVRNHIDEGLDDDGLAKEKGSR
ncbi:hypothetical protein F5Y15DRAFT_413401 [Xylariaceae sp. FL0016]|nr:hypothetical protein F5Y15DRAFT_413401 [Xylariaceae sp. FL0016]